MTTQWTRTLMTLTLVILLAPFTLPAQGLQDPVAIRNWQAPLYWQPNNVEEQATRARLRTAAPANIVGLSTDVGVQAQTPANSLVFVGMTPCRVVDTRPGSGFTGAFGGPNLIGGMSRTFPIQSSSTCSIPAVAQAYSFNITVVPNGFLDYITVWPTGQPRPLASTLNGYVNTVIANAAIVPAGTSGSVDVYASQNTHLIIDINGYYAAQSGITLAQGAAGAPSLSFNGDSGTGIFSSGSGMLDIATGGTSRLTVRPDGDLDLLGSGSLRKNGTLWLHILNNNAAFGFGALDSNVTGVRNTATGLHALTFNSTGSDNTATGNEALFSNTIGGFNTASGSRALYSNVNGLYNVASGHDALSSNTSGDDNVASGSDSLFKNTIGNRNTATGSRALYSNTAGDENTATGFDALFSNAFGIRNTAIGKNALRSNTSGSDNTAVGLNALMNSQSGYGNIAIGVSAGENAVMGSRNIMIGNVGVTSENQTMRLGYDCCSPTSYTVRTFIHGIRNTAPGNGDGVPVLIDSAGQVGTTLSSRRFKEDIQDMGNASSGLLRLRPVTFRYTQPYKDGSMPLDYGLIAEEVGEVFPDLVVTGPDGQVQTLQYQKLTPMLLNELQKQQKQLEAQAQTIRVQQEQNKKLEGRLATLEQLLSPKTPVPTKSDDQR